MKKLYSTILLLAMMVAALGFTACGDDDEEDDSGSGYSSFLVGTWQVEDEDSYADEVEYVQFKSNGTYINVQYDEDGLYITKGTWNVSDNELTMKETDGEWKGTSFTYTILSKGQSKLTLSMLGITSTLTKVSDSVIERYL